MDRPARGVFTPRLVLAGAVAAPAGGDEVVRRVVPCLVDRVEVIEGHRRGVGPVQVAPAVGACEAIAEVDSKALVLADPTASAVAVCAH